MTPPLTAHDLHRLADAIGQNPLEPIDFLIRHTFPLPSPESPESPESPVLPWGCVVRRGPNASADKIDAWGICNSEGTHCWQPKMYTGESWLSMILSHGYLSEAEAKDPANWPTTPPPDFKPEPAPVVEQGKGVTLTGTFYPAPPAVQPATVPTPSPVGDGERPDRTPKPLPVTTRTQLIGQQTQQAEAWCAVAQALDTHFPKWNPWCGRSATENAVLCIKEAATSLSGASEKVENQGDDDLQARYDTLYAQNMKALAKLSTVQADLQLSQGRVESLTEEAQRLAAQLSTANDTITSSAPALSDWRARCVVYSTNQGNTWHVESPDRQHNLNGNHNRWQLGQFFYHNETQARKALSLAPIYPGATPCERSDESGASGVSSSGTTTRASTSDPATTPPRTSASDAGAMPSPVAVTNGPNPLTAAHVEKNAGEPCKHINTHRSPDGNERCDWCGCVIPSPLPNAEQGKGEPMLPACAHDKGIHFQSDPSGGSDSSYTCKACGKELTNRERQEADRRSLVAALGAGFSLTKPEPAPQVLTGDGVPIEVYDRVWFNDDLPGQKTPDWAEVLTVTKDEVRFRPLQRVRWLVPELCFSTRKAALASLPEPAPVGEGVNVDTPVGPIIVVGQASINNVVTMRDKLRDALAGEAVRREGDAVA